MPTRRHAVDGSPPDAREAGRLLFAGPCHFVTGAAGVDSLPPSVWSEVAFAGRSNVGKSSLVNALTGRRTLAHTSNTPGRTQQINFFDLASRLMLVDLPGYGHAVASKQRIAAWTDLVKRYLRGRVPLRRVCLLMDGRHGPKPNDEAVMTLLDQAAVSYRIVLTKIDKIAPADLAAVTDRTVSTLRPHPAAFPTPIATSAETGDGIADLRADLVQFAEPVPPTT